VTTLFEELAFAPTSMGELSLRRRRILSLDIDVLEVKLGEEHLMSSLFTAGERALASLGLAAIERPDLNVVVGGLGLGYTAVAALEEPCVCRLEVIEALEPVIDWHRRGLAPLGGTLLADSRCRLLHGDFFAFARGDGPTLQSPVDVVLLDIDHSPSALLSSAHGGFYTAEGLRQVAGRLASDGVFAMWSDAAPESEFQCALTSAFHSVRADIVEFPNPLQDKTATCTIYISRSPR
jgi:spermidine synthase